ncbi:amidohydrolase [Haloechinothrix sp. LS1_15]|uniref:amidohydrolase n=1 Tax=Haloechinothrix sp. LS1_15 TaxID=2652248 RepID=UPI0029478285|nr:amidohydrolase [Haloechinothrix sp. LS1_15]MDV6011930.1 amidohydrolase [Haloechinothrix sp. LS1_15]
MDERTTAVATGCLRSLDSRMPELEALYEDLHRHPELGFAETRTAAACQRWLRGAGYEVTGGFGGTGVAGVLRNGDGPTVLLRADMDALPVAEATGLPYAATGAQRGSDGREVSVMHACGHDVHVTCLLGAAESLAAGRQWWRGTVVAVCQPNEEEGKGAAAMLDDGLYAHVPVPDVVLGQHVSSFPAGVLAYREGLAMAAADSFRITMYGSGGHGSRPESTVDPVVMAAALVQRLQGIVAREVAPGEQAVVTVGSLRAGEAPNVIADHAVLTVNVRTFDDAVRERVLAAIGRMARAEATASSSPREPEIVRLSEFPSTVNDEATATAVNSAFGAYLGQERLMAAPATYGSEDVGWFATRAGAPLYYWWLGGWEPDEYRAAAAEGRVDADIPSNHSPRFAPVKQPTLTAGVQALVVAALDRLATPAQATGEPGTG